MSRNQHYFKCSVCGEANQSKRPRFCRNCRAEFVYDGDSPTPTNTIPFSSNPPVPNNTNEPEPSPDGSYNFDCPICGHHIEQSKQPNACPMCKSTLIFNNSRIPTNALVSENLEARFEKKIKKGNRWPWIIIAILFAIFLIMTLNLFGVEKLFPPHHPTTPTAIETTQPATVQQPATVITYPTEPVIWAKYKGQMTNFGIYFDRTNPIGERISYTNRNLLIPNKAWNEPLTPAELRKIETTWVPVDIDLPEGASLVIFAGGLRQNGKVIGNDGIYVDVNQPGFYRNLEIRNGEAVIWFNDQNKAADWERIKVQVQSGNFDIRHSLELTQIYK